MEPKSSGGGGGAVGVWALGSALEGFSGVLSPCGCDGLSIPSTPGSSGVPSGSARQSPVVSSAPLVPSSAGTELSCLASSSPKPPSDCPGGDSSVGGGDADCWAIRGSSGVGPVEHSRSSLRKRLAGSSFSDGLPGDDFPGVSPTRCLLIRRDYST